MPEIKQEETTQPCIGICTFIKFSLTSGMGATREQELKKLSKFDVEFSTTLQYSRL
jgi:hypothetical protein